MRFLYAAKKTVAIVLLLVGAVNLARAQAPGQHSWKMIWNDEFDYKGLPDTSKWKYNIGAGGWGNNELEFYTANRLENARVENGALIIEARKEKWNNSNYTSARLFTKGKGDLKYGRIEVQAKI